MVWTKGEEEVKAGGRFRFLFEDEETIALIIKSKIYLLFRPRGVTKIRNLRVRQMST